MPRLAIGELFKLVEDSSSEYFGSFNYLLQIGALQRLSPPEVDQLGRGASVPGNLCAIVDGHSWNFFRVARPEDLYACLAAQLNSSSQPLPHGYETDAMYAAKIVGLNPAQLAEAKQYDVPDTEMQAMRRLPIPLHFIPSMYFKAEKAGDALRLRMIAGYLTRWHEEQKSQLSALSGALDFVESCCDPADGCKAGGKQTANT